VEDLDPGSSQRVQGFPEVFKKFILQECIVGLLGLKNQFHHSGRLIILDVIPSIEKTFALGWPKDYPKSALFFYIKMCPYDA